MILLSAPVIAVGTAVAGTGSVMITFGIAVSGLGILIGVVGKSSDAVRKAIIAGAVISAAGGLAFISGLLIQGLGYFMLPVGGLLALSGMGLAGYSCRKIFLPESEDRQISESIINVTDEIRKNQEMKDETPVIFLDMNN